MKVRYTGNSGFAAELDEDLLIFDCYDPENHPWLFEKSKSAKSVTVFVSHAHRDHYSPKIRGFSKISDAKFVVSYDVPNLPGAFSVKSGDTIDVNGLGIRVFGSTDAGVSFFVRHKSAGLFHAGDLNNWHWADESEPHEIEKAEKDFLAILDSIQKGCGCIDLAFFPVDPRMGTNYYKGAVQFSAKMKPAALMPMHFGKAFWPPEAFYQEMDRYTVIIAPDEAVWTDI